MRVWADKEGLTAVALSVLSEEMSKRRLPDDPQNQVRIAQLKRGLVENRGRFERGQRRIARRAQVCAVVFTLALVGAFIVWLFLR
jgi:hypothetical protein